MPGMWGSLGVSSDAPLQLTEAFRRIWGEGESLSESGATLGGHAFGEAVPLRTFGSGLAVAVDGEASIYGGCHGAFGTLSAGLHDVPAQLPASRRSVGNYALLSADRRTLILMSDWSGIIPLYCARAGDGFIFSSLLAPLARAVEAEPDHISVMEFLRGGYITDGRTLFDGVHRLQAGQVIRFSLDTGLTCEETSPLWSGEQDIDPESATEAARTYLREALRASLDGSSGVTLMMSGGWDSRTLLAGMSRSSNGSLAAYSHGASGSRELGIVRRLCQRTGVPLRFEPIDDRIFDPDLRGIGGSRAENLLFPHWLRAGRLHEGGDTLVAGVLGEVLGGHYGPAMLERGLSRVFEVAFPLFTGRSTRRARGDKAFAAASDHLRQHPEGPRWYLDADFEESLCDLTDRINERIVWSLRRLQRRGVDDPVRLIEAYISEHRAAQYFAAQLLNSRAYTDVSFPFAQPEFLHFASTLPFPIKIHNSLNRKLILRESPELLREPTAAMLVPAYAPVPVQEISRMIRKGVDAGRGLIPGRRRSTSRSGWVDFTFLRGSRHLEVLVDSLESEIWDRASIRQRIAELQTAPVTALHPFFDQFSKILTVDTLLSNGR